ncbi:hypothetical protein KFL_000990060 [Klebsormidium nitens]|uniref:Uncharacterized protein n=1 Tax=Klebsormidium nitens TaxID=105231 RepID=A0A1Y1HZV0_KLENI|nr:hypothetical protein KFL_000990060 [Klebsormidium nitens]|eukprot:GAQ82057.1 hypothetical protein KFL_000990060 [Klebsormidium nitens]
MASPCCWGPSGGLGELSWRDTAGQAAVRLMMELSMLKGRLQEQEGRTRNAEERAAVAEKEREAHRKTLQQLQAAEKENETLLNVIQKHSEIIQRVKHKEQELDTEAGGIKVALKSAQSENVELRREMARVTREKNEAEHLAGQIADALDAELSKGHSYDEDVAAVEARLREAQAAQEQLAQEKQDLQRACSRMTRDLKAAKERVEEAAVKERSASIKLGKAAVEASQIRKQLDAQANRNKELLSENGRLQEEVRLLRATLAQREVLIRDLREGVDTSASAEAEMKTLEIRRSPSASSLPGKGTPRTPSGERSSTRISMKKLGDGSGFVDKRCTDGQLSARSVEPGFESGKVELSRIPVAAAG